MRSGGPPRLLSAGGAFGWDDMAESSFLIPSLSTVHMDLETLGARSMKELIARIRGFNTSAETLTLDPMELVMRESTGPVRAPGAQP